MDFLKDFFGRYETRKVPLTIEERKFHFHVPERLDPLLDPDDPLKDFPLWARIWEASILLAHTVATIPPDSGQRLLEIGAGLGVVGVVAARFGHHVTITEYDERALDFIKANLVENHCDHAEIFRLDWHHPELPGTFDIVVGSEILYREQDFPAIYSLLKKYLRPGGKVILAEGLRKTSVEFFAQAGKFYQIEARKKVITLKDEKLPIILATMKPK